MENSNDTSNDKKSINKAKSYSSGPPKKLKSVPIKRKSFNANEAVHSLDLAGGRLKKSKLVNGESTTSSDLMNPVRGDKTNMFIDSVATPSVNFRDVDNTSLISMNFSHYELMRNLSLSNCNSDEALGSSFDAFSSLTDITSRDETLERYFRSVEMWSRNPKTNGTK
ncbi:unnamed protein product [Euphydryas editha]|uniref:Uncharacterized protein n=1 Tax=Euphydryas editha TaxID=104508 RepID=A0AAU9V530_EUPED|nr:unnamed protein product [Euphydryas editha]